MALYTSLGTGVWAVDWMLYAMTLCVGRINMQLGSNFKISPWQPNNHTSDNPPPAVSGLFYGHVFVADFIGGDKSELRVGEVDTSREYVTAYAGYHDDVLSKVAVVDTMLWRAGSNDSRQVENVTVAVDGADNVRVERLTGKSGDSLENVMWAGQKWMYESDGTAVGEKDTLVLNVTGGVVNVSVGATEAVLISLQ